MSLTGTLLFHLNLRYSAIEVAARRTVVERAYGPLLALAEERPWLRLALECSGHTLELVNELDPDWVLRLRRLLEAGRVELVGSGDTQLAGPLVPAAVNRWNQRLGRETYARLLGCEPDVALVNEMAWSQGLVDAYAEAGYRGVVMEWGNPRRSHPDWDEEWRYHPARTQSPSGRGLGVLWADTVTFQKFQRAVMGELPLEDYVDWVTSRRGENPRHVFLYANDAEIFDYRPGRYVTEPPLTGESEWVRMGRLLDAVRAAGVSFGLPGEVLDDPAFGDPPTVQLTSAADPVPVKKQPKYNVTRWALSGHDDVGLNAHCFARARRLEVSGGTPADWQALCRDWSSDLRTHLTESRWKALRDRLPALPRSEPEPEEPRLGALDVRRDGDRLHVRTAGVEITLLGRRGLALERVAFGGGQAQVGTLPHGYFDDVDHAADFYTGHLVLEVPGRKRVTDLERVEPALEESRDRLSVRAAVPTPLGPLEKVVDIFRDRVRVAYRLSRWSERPLCRLRVAHLTLLPEAWGPELFVSTEQGGPTERMPVPKSCDHGRGVSTLVTAGAAFGATAGRLSLDDGARGVTLSWPNHLAAALPMLSCEPVSGSRPGRVALSLSEIDETLREGQPLHDFEWTLSALERDPR